MNWFTGLFSKFNSLCLTFFVSLIAISPSVSQAAADPTQDIRKVFREQLLTSIGDAFLNNGLLDWSGNNILKSLFGICLAIAIFQVVYRHYGTNGFLLEWVKIPIYALIALSILGGWSGYQKVLKIPTPPHVKNRIKTLDKDIYYALAMQFDKLAEQLDRIAGPDQYQTESAKLFIAMKNIQYGIMKCNVAGGKQCLFESLSNMNREVEAPMVEHQRDPGVFDSLKLVAQRLMELMDIMFSPIPFWFLYVLIWLLEIIRMFINYFTLIVFALMTAISLFFCKLFTVFLVLPDFRQKIWNAYKMPLSATMYGFMTSLIISCATVIVRGINDAMVKSLISQLQANNTITTMDAMHVLFGTTLATTSILGIQILSMSKVPGLCRKLWDLSLTELAEFGKTIIESGLGALKMVAGAAVMGGAALMTGGAAAIAARAGGSSMGGAMTSGLQGAGRSLSNFAGGQGPVGPGGLKGLLGLAGTNSTSSGGSQMPSSNLGSISGGAPSTPSVSTGSGDSSSSSGSGGSGSSSGGGGGGGGAARIGIKRDIAAENKASLRDQKLQTIEKGIKGAWTVGKGLGAVAGAGIGAAFGQDVNPLKMISSGTSGATMGISSALSSYSEGQAVKQELMRNNMDQLAQFSSNSAEKFELNDQDTTALSGKIKSGNADEQDYIEFNKMLNNGDKSNISDQTKSEMDSAQKFSGFTQWNQKRESAITEAMNQAVTRNKKGEISGINYANSGELQNLMSGGYVTRGDFSSNKDLYAITGVNKQARLDEIQKAIKLEKKEATVATKSGAVSRSLEHESMVESLERRHREIKNENIFKTNYVRQPKPAPTSESEQGGTVVSTSSGQDVQQSQPVSPVVQNTTPSTTSTGSMGTSSPGEAESKVDDKKEKDEEDKSKKDKEESDKAEATKKEAERVEEVEEERKSFEQEYEKLIKSEEYQKMTDSQKKKAVVSLNSTVKRKK